MNKYVLGRWLAAILVVLALTSLTVAQAAILRVGSGTGCTYGTIQAAINAANSGDDIRVLGGQVFTENVDLIGKSLELRGGFNSCMAPGSDPDNPSIIDGGGSGTTLFIGSAAAMPTVLVRNFVITNGFNEFDGGGGIEISGDNFLVRLDNVQIQANTTYGVGGGIRLHSVSGGAVLRLEGGSVIGGDSALDGNQAAMNGGGISCQNAAIEWIDARIRYNTAGGAGGGMQLDDCVLSMPAITDANPLRSVDLSNNSAGSSGGGINAQNGSVVSMNSSPRRQVRIANNHASFAGGGMRLTDSSSFSGDGIQIDDNSADTNGGGLFVVNAAEVYLTRGDPAGSTCADLIRCSTINGNSALGSGSAIYAGSGSQLDIRQTFIEDNVANNGSVIRIGEVTTTGELNNIQLSENAASGGIAALVQITAASLVGRNLTVAGNSTTSVFNVSSNANLTVNDSILWQPGSAIFSTSNPGVLVSFCNNASEAVLNAVTHDPGFASFNGLGGNLPIFQLADHSLNVDACSSIPAPLEIDALGNTRLVDVPETPNLAGILDRGAFELSLPIFRNGFE